MSLGTLCIWLMLLCGNVITRDIHFAFNSSQNLALTMQNDRLFASRDDGLINCYNKTSGALIKTFAGHTAQVWAIAASGEYLYTGSFDTTVKIWNITSGDLIRTILEDGIGMGYYGIWNGFIIGGGYDGMLTKRVIRNGALSRRIVAHNGVIYGVGVVGNLIFTSSGDGTVKKFNADTLSLLDTIQAHDAPIRCIAVGEEYFFTGGDDYLVKQWSVATGEFIRTFAAHIGAVFSVALTGDDLFSAGVDSFILKWSISTGIIAVVMHGHDNSNFNLLIDDGYLYSAGGDHSIKKWDVLNGINTQTITTDSREIRSIDFGPESLILGKKSGDVVQLQLPFGRPMRVYEGHTSAVYSAVYHEGYIYSGGYDSSLKQWDLSSGRLIRTFEGNTAGIEVVLISGDYIFSCGYDRIIRRWDLASGSLLTTYTGHVNVVTGMFNISSSLYSGSLDGRIIEWDISTGLLKRVLEPNAYRIISLVHYEELIIAGDTLSRIVMWNIASGQIVNSITSLPAFVYSLALYKDTIIAGDLNGALTVYDIRTGATITSLQNHQSSIWTLMVRGDYLYSSGTDGIIMKHSMIDYSVAERIVTYDDTIKQASVLEDGSIGVVAENRFLKINVFRNEIVDSLYLKFPIVGYFVKGDLTVIVTSSTLGITVRYASFLGLQITSFFSIWTNSTCTAFTSNYESSHIFMGFDNGQILSVDVERNETRIVRNLGGPKVENMYSTGNLLFVYDSSGSLTKLESTGSNFQEVKVFAVSDVTKLAGNGEFVVAGTNDGRVLVWKVEEFGLNTAELVDIRTSHRGAVTDVFLTKNYAYTCGFDQDVKQWDLRSLRRISSSRKDFVPSSLAVLRDSLLVTGIQMISTIQLRQFDSPETLQNVNTTFPSATTTIARNRITPILPINTTNEPQSSPLPLGILLPIVIVVFLSVGIYVYVIFRRRKAPMSELNKSSTFTKALSETTQTDLSTSINTYVGLSKHAEHLLSAEYFAAVKRIGKSAVGEVSLVQIMDPSLRSKFGTYAVQKISFLTSKNGEDAFNQELAITTMLETYPFFVKLVGYTENPLSMILQYYPEGSLDGWMKRNSKSMSYAVVTRFIYEIATALQTMHEHYLAHCDIKTQNILVDVVNGTPSCRLTDFGITQVLSNRILATSLFQVVNLRGLSVFYASPESFVNFKNKTYAGSDFRKYDVYSYACVVYELLHKKKPWH